MNLGRKKYVAVAGPTASGKSALALRLATVLAGEIVNCDSVQVYRGFDIGAAKPSAEERKRIPHHLLDVVGWEEDYDARRFAREAEAAIETITARGCLPVVVGGTGLYLRALFRENWHDLPKDENLRRELTLLSNEDLHAKLQQVDPRRAAQIHLNDRYRLLRAVEIVTLLGKAVTGLPALRSVERMDCFLIVLEPVRQVLHHRIEERAAEMVAQGLIEEVQGLLAAGCPESCKPMLSIGYKEVVESLRKSFDAKQVTQAIAQATKNYAKRQFTWFRKVEADLRLGNDYEFNEILQKVREATGRE